jgi:alpha-1,2-mannosyltransferase
VRRRSVSIVVAVLALAGFAWFSAVVLPPAVRGEPDFPNYYFAGELLLSGEPVYGSLTSLVEERLGVSSYEAYPADPPATVVLLSPLSLLPYETAWVAFAFMSAVILFGVGYGVGREIGWPRETSVAVGTLVLVTSAGRFLLVRNHMESILLLVLFLGWRALRRGHEVPAGVWWGIAAALKLFPALLIVGLIAGRKRRAAVAAASTAAGITVAAVLVAGWGTTVAFVTDVLPLSAQWYGALGNYSLLSFGTALTGTWLGWSFLAVGGIALVAVYSGGARSADEIWIAGMAAALLITPLSWVNYLVLVLPGLVVVIDKFDLDEVRDRWLALGLIVALGFWGPIVLGSRVPTVLVSFLPTYGLIMLFATAIRRPWSKQLSYL